jgi:hydrogenase/urease accessory protein HupE
MKGKIATLLGATSAMGIFSSTVLAHPGHSPADVTAQLGAPLAGPDHIMAFVVAGALAALGAARFAIYLASRRSHARIRSRRN